MKYIQEPNRIYAESDDHKFVGEVTYQNAGDNLIIIDHTLVETAYRGRGIAAELVKQAVDLAIKNNKKVVPLCPYAKAEFNRNPEYKVCEYGLGAKNEL